MIRQVRKTLRGSAGFTLVELVVVIAVLGILAGVGTVGYSGYIQRANEAVDDTLYHDIIYAGAIGSYADPGASGRVTVTKSNATVTSTQGAESKAIVEKWLSDAFGSDWANTVKYKTDTYADNDQFSVIALPAENPYNLAPDDLTHVGDYEDSNFSGNEADIANTVNGVADVFADWLYDGKDFEGVKNTLVGLMGGEDELNAFLEKYGLSETSDQKTVANAVVKYVASKAGDINVDDLISQVSGGSEMEVNLENIALMYGALTGYANSDYASDSFKTAYENLPTSLEDIYALLTTARADGDSWESYFSDEGSGGLKQDLEGYQGALQLLDKYGDKIDIQLDDAFSSDSTLALLQAILNGK